MRDIEVTKRELLVGIVIVFFMTSIGFFISTSIHNSVSTDNEKYFKALKVNDNEELFNHTINTNVGDVISYGIFKANKSVSDKKIKGEYFSIKKIEEHYVQKTRTVTYTDSNGNTQTRIETYWEWDEWKREYFNTKTFNHLGKDFKYESINFNHYEYNKTVNKKGFSNVRWKFYTIPIEFNASLYSKVTDHNIHDTKLFPNVKIKELIDKKEKEADNAIVFFWIVWLVLTTVLVIVFIALDNKYLNDY